MLISGNGNDWFRVVRLTLFKYLSIKSQYGNMTLMCRYDYQYIYLCLRTGNGNDQNFQGGIFENFAGQGGVFYRKFRILTGSRVF